MLMVAEMTGEFSMLIPAMLATSIAYLVTGSTSIYESQVPTRADSPAHRNEYAIPLISTIRVGDAMRSKVITARPDDTVDDAEQRMAENAIRGLPVLDEGRLVGMFTATDALRAHREGNEHVVDAMTGRLQYAHPDESLHVALQRMTTHGISRLPVVPPGQPERMVGIISVRDLAKAMEMEVRALTNGTRSAKRVTA
jgi:CIC family chloride channel protein